VLFVSFVVIASWTRFLVEIEQDTDQTLK